MQKSLRTLESISGWLAHLALWIAGIGLVLMTVFVFAQVFVRYVLNDSLHWVEPVSIMLMSWFIFLGAAVGVREGYHLSFDVLRYVLPERAAGWLHSISDLAVLSFGIGMVIYGWQLVVQTWGSSVPALHIPGGFTYLPIFVGGVLTTLFSIERLALRFAGMTVDHEPTTDDVLVSEV